MQLRLATPADRDHIRDIHRHAFPAGEGEIVSLLAVDLLLHETSPPTISVLAECAGELAGHVAFSPVSFEGSSAVRGYILAPLGVLPGYQKRGIGAALIQNGMQQLSEAGINMLFVYGDPEYYGRFGFDAHTAEAWIPPYQLEFPFGWQAIVLNEFQPLEPPVKISCVAPLCDPGLW